MKVMKGELNKKTLMFKVEGRDLELNGTTIMYCSKRNIPYGSEPIAINRHDETPETLYFHAFRQGFKSGKLITLPMVAERFGLGYLIGSLYSKNQKETIQTYREGFNAGVTARKEVNEKPGQTLKLEILVSEEQNEN